MKKALVMILCVSLLTLMSGCGLDTLAGLAGFNLNGVDINGLVNQVQTLVSQYTAANPSQGGTQQPSKNSNPQYQYSWCNSGQ
jgi:hypothetical protein